MDVTLWDNYSLQWARLIVSQLKKWEIDHYFISPGYRNVPLVAALVEMQSDIEKVVCFDERSASFQALGYAKGAGKPAVLICTSGTAGANYYPAVIEAYKEEIPLIVITADRPFELVHSGANQVIEQSQLYGGFVRKSLDLPVASHEFNPEVVLANISFVVQASLKGHRGPVHINVPFREPLVKSESSEYEDYKASVYNAIKEDSQVPVVMPKNDVSSSLEGVKDYLLGISTNAKRGLVVVGALDGDDERNKVMDFIKETLGWPSYFDICSSMRTSEYDYQLLDLSIAKMQQLLIDYDPDCVIHFGRRLTSKFFDAFLSGRKQKNYIVINPLDRIQDPTYQASLRLCCNPGEFVDIFPADVQFKNSQGVSDVFRKELSNLKSIIGGYLADNSGGGEPLALPIVASQLLQMMYDNSVLFLGNSSTVRAFDLACIQDYSKEVKVYSNRGVSGIEGLCSSAIGLSRGLKKGVTVVLGDVSLIHDLNSLLSLNNTNYPICVICINDSGGGIFRRLPVASFDEILTPYLTTPHEYEFSKMAEFADIDYYKANNMNQFIEAYAKYKLSNRTMFIECRVDSTHDKAVWDTILAN